MRFFAVLLILSPILTAQVRLEELRVSGPQMVQLFPESETLAYHSDNAIQGEDSRRSLTGSTTISRTAGTLVYRSSNQTTNQTISLTGNLRHGDSTSEYLDNRMVERLGYSRAETLLRANQVTTRKTLGGSVTAAPTKWSLNSNL